MRKHNDECHTKKCTDCVFKARNKQEMKRHMRDQHDIITGSTSPPLKRKRKTLLEEDETNENMDIDSDVDEKFENLSSKFEDMDIEVEDCNNEEKVHRDRSDKMDAKIKEKEKLDSAQELKKEKKRKQDMLKKSLEEQLKLERLKIENKLRKQRIKNQKKKTQNQKKQNQSTEKSSKCW